jgi:hypothetical protein
MRGSTPRQTAYSADMKKFSEFLIAAIILASHASADALSFPSFSPGARVRVTTLTRERCIGSVNEWSPTEMVVELDARSGCNSASRLMRIKPFEVRKVESVRSTNSAMHPFWHVVSRPLSWTVKVAGGALVVALIPVLALIKVLDPHAFEGWIF